MNSQIYGMSYWEIYRLLARDPKSLKSWLFTDSTETNICRSNLVLPAYPNARAGTGSQSARPSNLTWITFGGAIFEWICAYSGGLFAALCCGATCFDGCSRE